MVHSYRIYPTTPGIRSDWVKLVLVTGDTTETTIARREWVSLLITMVQAIGLNPYEFITHDHQDIDSQCSENCKSLAYGENLYSHDVLTQNSSSS